MFSSCCARAEDGDEHDMAWLEGRADLRVQRRLRRDRTQCGSTDSESAAEDESSGARESPRSVVVRRLAHTINQAAGAELVESLAQMKGVLEGFAQPALQGQVAEQVHALLFGPGKEQSLYLSANRLGGVAFGRHEEAPGAELVYRLEASHTRLAGQGANELRVEQELGGVVRLQQIIAFLRGVSELASSRSLELDEEELLDGLGGALPALSALLATLVEDDSSELWLDRADGAVTVRVEATIDLDKVCASSYGSVAESLERVQRADVRIMQCPAGSASHSREDLRASVKTKALDDFLAAAVLELLPGEAGGRSRAKHTRLLRLDLCMAEDSQDLVWMNPKSRRPAAGLPRVVLDEHDPDFVGRCLLGFEMRAGLTELGCGSLSLPKTIAVIDYFAEEAVDASGVAATVSVAPVHMDWHGLVRFLARPLIDLRKLERLLLSDFSLTLRNAPQSESMEVLMARRGIVQGFGLFPDMPAEPDDWTVTANLSAKLVRPAQLVLTFVRNFVSGQLETFGELLLLRDVLLAFLSDVQALQAAAAGSGKEQQAK